MRHMTIELEREHDGRFIAEVTDLPGVLAYGATEREAVDRAKASAEILRPAKSTGLRMTRALRRCRR
jgi:predicted RNase H-like HicB family nuclease